MKGKIKIAVIGCGKIAQVRHIPELFEHPEVELTAICDMNLIRAEGLAKQYAIPRVYSDVRELLLSTDIDAVTVCTPNVSHAEMTLLSLRAGKHVLVEKPMATDWSDCRLMVDTAAAENKILLVGHNQRLHPVYQRGKEILQSGTIGQVIQFTTHFQHGGPELWSVDKANNWFLQSNQAVFGVLGDLGVHKIDMIRWMLDDRIAELSSYSSSRRKIDVEDNAVIIMRLAGGSIGTVNLSWSNPLQEHRTIFYGEKGQLIMGESMDGIRIELHSGDQHTEKVELTLRQDGGLRSGIIDEFVRCMQEGSELGSVLSGQDALVTMDSLFKVFR